MAETPKPILPTTTSNPISANDDTDNDMAFICNICLEGVKDREPVVTQCGHLYCWPCLYRWINTRNSESTCPICKAGVTQENVIPIFIRGSSTDPRRSSTSCSDQIPNRPQGHRPALPDLSSALPTGATYNAQIGGISISAGIGFFPSLFGLQFQQFTQTLPQQVNQQDELQKAYLSRILLGIGVTVIVCLLFF